ncbi:MAG: SET domain-containing protein [Verrucomicrobia bacterium]|nr:SET domain-containing protein [Verrucomicrobiota bacterium]MBS0636661.1 SET domain-containing protein [Verrucomicrobiota bacterium]
MLPLYYVNKPEYPALFEGIIQYRGRNGQDRTISGREFKDLTGADYVAASFPTRKFFEIMLVNGDAYSHRYPAASDLKLRLVHLEGENAFVGLDVVAARVIKAGEVICHYNGQYVAADERGGDYQLGEVDAAKFRGLAAMINHSFPNAMFGCWDHAGFREWVILALDDIDVNERVSVNYGHDYNSVSLGKHAELRYEAAARFVKSSQLALDGLGELKNAQKWHYLATNPTLILELYFNGDWSWQEISLFLRDVAVCTIKLLDTFETIRDWLIEGIGALDATFQSMKELKPAMYKEIIDYFRQVGRERSCVGAVYAFKLLAEGSFSWPQVKEKLDTYVSAWELVRKSRDEQEFNDDTPVHRAARFIKASF